MALSRVELIAGVAAAFLCGAGASRLALPRQATMRPLSIEGLHIKSEPIASGQTLSREAAWTCPTDVYVIGWSYNVGAIGANPELFLMHRDTVLFFGQRGGGAPGANPAFYREGAGYRLPAGEPLSLRLTMTNRGAPGDTQGAAALVYFVPVAGN